MPAQDPGTIYTEGPEQAMTSREVPSATVDPTVRTKTYIVNKRNWYPDVDGNNFAVTQTTATMVERGSFGNMG